MIQFAYLIGSLFLMLIWFMVFLKLKSRESRREMLRVSLATSFLGLTEPIFVPEYWNPPTLFDLAQTTGFDIESLVFAFAVGGIAVSAYESFTKVKHVKLSTHEMHDPKHKLHLLALFATPISFIFLYATTPLNPIYSTILALLVGAMATFYCRPDLIRKIAASGFIFLIIYFLFFVIFNLVFPGYTEEIWNLPNISGILILSVPLEELVFAFTLGLMWSSVYEHTTWKKINDWPI